MSVQAIAWVLEKSNSELGARLVLLSIANHARSDGTGAWPSLATVAKEAHLCEREVRYSLRKLELAGELQTQVKAGPYGTNMYSLPKMVEGQILPQVGHSNAGEGQSLPGGGAIQCPRVGQPNAPDPSFNRPLKDKERNELFRLIDDYHKNKTHIDESGRKYKISPSTRQRIYLT